MIIFFNCKKTRNDISQSDVLDNILEHRIIIERLHQFYKEISRYDESNNPLC